MTKAQQAQAGRNYAALVCADFPKTVTGRQAYDFVVAQGANKRSKIYLNRVVNRAQVATYLAKEGIALREGLEVVITADPVGEMVASLAGAR